MLSAHCKQLYKEYIMGREYIGRSFKPAEITEMRKELERIEMLKGRPARQTVINGDDITNLQIAFATATSLEDFISRI